MNEYKKVFLIILDGFGLASPGPANAITEAQIPFLNSLISKFPSFSLAAASLVVGMPWGKYGNSEVGHSALGTGRVFVQDLARINKQIRSGDFYKNPVLLTAVEHVKNNNSTLHFIGAVSPGGIHSHEDHLIALLDFATKNSIENIGVHMFTDGRDTPPNDGINSFNKILPYLEKSKAKIGSISGRMYSMDRILNWALTEEAWKAMMGVSQNQATDVGQYIQDSYKNNLTDYDIPSATIVENGAPVAPIKDNDAVIFFHFRNDRMVQLVTSFAAEPFSEFTRNPDPQNLFITTMTRYSETLPVSVAFEPLHIENTLGDVIGKQGFTQLRLAEKEKEAHVTNFFNGGRINPLPGEERVIVSSRRLKGDEYLQHPEMSAEKIVESVLEKMNTDEKLYVINFANADMIAHTGNLKATTKAIQILDSSLEKLITAISQNPENAVVITADHGNAEELIDPETGGEDTQHSTRNVPAIFIGQGLELAEPIEKDINVLSEEPPIGSLIDIAPSVLYLLGIEKPAEMSGSTLIS